MPNDKQKRLKIQQGVISVASVAMIVFVLTWLINTAVTGRKNGLNIDFTKEEKKSGSSISRKTESKPAEESKADTESKTNTVKYSSDSSEPENADKPYEGAAMKDDFSDACFIGDSRTVGLEMNSDKAKADFYASQGLNISTALTDAVVTLDNGNMGTVIDGASQKPYKRIFIMFGINELGWPYPENFVSQYVELVNAVKEAQPEADIYIESVLPVSYKAAETNEVFTNEHIDNFNDYVKQVAEQTGTNYLDINSYFKDDSGSLPEDAAADGIHFVRDYCLEWIDILAYLVPQDPAAAADIAAKQSEAEANAASDETYDDGTADEAEGEYGFLDPDGYVPEEEDDGVVDGNGNVDYGDGQQDVYTDDEYDYSYDNNDGYVDDGI
ncbi:MAG: hypothetical protein K6C68_03325 [Ruminococcus sp.]|nr:hypothetical protein [Ruminococcus sp.]